MVSKELLCRMQLESTCSYALTNMFFWEWSILTEAQPNSRTGALAKE